MKQNLKSFALPLTALTIFLASAAVGAENEPANTESHENRSMGGFGFHGGLNFSDFDYTNTTVNSAKKKKTGALLGIHFEGYSMGLVGMRIEANYSKKGYEIGNIATVTHNYLQIPLLFKIAPVVGPVILFAEAGPAAQAGVWAAAG